MHHDYHKSERTSTPQLKPKFPRLFKLFKVRRQQERDVRLVLKECK